MSRQSFPSFQPFDWADDANEEAESLSAVRSPTNNVNTARELSQSTSRTLQQEASSPPEPSSPISASGSSTGSWDQSSPEEWHTAPSSPGSVEEGFRESSIDDLFDSEEEQKGRDIDTHTMLNTAQFGSSQTHYGGSNDAYTHHTYTPNLYDIVEEDEEDEVDEGSSTDTNEDHPIPHIVDEQPQNAWLNTIVYQNYYYGHTRYGFSPRAMPLMEEQVPSMPKPSSPYDGEFDLDKRKAGRRALQPQDIQPPRAPFAEQQFLWRKGIVISYAGVARSEFTLTEDQLLRRYRAKPSCLRCCWTFESD